MRRKFDKVIHREFRDIAIIDYGIIKGNNTIIFIKAGQNGSIYGYENKYLIIADTINKRYGYTVICSSNPFDGTNHLDNAMEVIDKYVKKNKFSNYQIYYMGTSNGALIGAQFGYLYSKIIRMLLINAPLMYNLHKTKAGIENFNGERIIMIYGSIDPSYRYVELLSTVKNDKFKYYIVEGQDHYFSKDIYDFKKLPEDYLVNNM